MVDKILVKPVTPMINTTTASGLFVPVESRLQEEAIVVAIGDQTKLGLKIGDRVMYNKKADPVWVGYNEEQYLLLFEKDVLVVVEN
jgi:co-chaperonin GroES (HSP10)